MNPIPIMTGLVARVGAEDGPALHARLVSAGVRLNPLAEALLHDPRMAAPARAEEIEVVAVSVASLGFPEGATFAPLVAAAAARGLGLCPLALAPWLRLQLSPQDELSGEGPRISGQAPPGALTVASAPPPDEEEVPWGFYLRRVDGERWLRGYVCWSGHVWGAGDLLVFARGAVGRAALAVTGP